MKLAILCGANPRAHKIENGANVRVHEGKWRVLLEGVTSSVLAFQLQSGLMFSVHDKMPIEIKPGGDSIRAFFVHTGVEEYVNAYIEHVLA